VPVIAQRQASWPELTRGFSSCFFYPNRLFLREPNLRPYASEDVIFHAI
jgi:hypothetical protein